MSNSGYYVLKLSNCTIWFYLDSETKKGSFKGVHVTHYHGKRRPDKAKQTFVWRSQILPRPGELNCYAPCTRADLPPEVAARFTEIGVVPTWVSSYCNRPHVETSGVPIGHECRILPPEAIAAEKAGDIPRATECLRAEKHVLWHRGR